MGFPLRWSGRTLSKRFDAQSAQGWVSRHLAAMAPTSPRNPGVKRAGSATLASLIPRRNSGIDSCAPPGVHLTSQQHRSASTTGLPPGSAPRAPGAP
ncbi:hypothetical protein B1H29_10305 [Streptomyces pactum]|uniref:Uncharacterized protein n=1 Tax=Streptomyces pactum TaxID=68249 RepID=A0A1S6J680_9ACTN|nr:hypothetical protein B1H29_10305 [Streptomyces pactum]